LGNNRRGWSQRSDLHRYVTPCALLDIFNLLTHFYAQMMSFPRFTQRYTSQSPTTNGTSSHKPSSSASPLYGKMLSRSPSLAPLRPRPAQHHHGTPDLSLAANPSTHGTPTRSAFFPLERRMGVMKKATRGPSCCGSVSAERAYCESTGCVGRLGGADS